MPSGEMDVSMSFSEVPKMKEIYDIIEVEVMVDFYTSYPKYSSHARWLEIYVASRGSRAIVPLPKWAVAASAKHCGSLNEDPSSASAAVRIS